MHVIASTIKIVVAEKFYVRKRQGEATIYGMVMEAGKAAPAGGGPKSSVEAHFFRLYINANVTDEKLRESILNMEKGKRVIIITQVLKYPGSGRLTPKSKVSGPDAKPTSIYNNNRLIDFYSPSLQHTTNYNIHK